MTTTFEFSKSRFWNILRGVLSVAKGLQGIIDSMNNQGGRGNVVQRIFIQGRTGKACSVIVYTSLPQAYGMHTSNECMSDFSISLSEFRLHFRG